METINPANKKTYELNFPHQLNMILLSGFIFRGASYQFFDLYDRAVVIDTWPLIALPAFIYGWPKSDRQNKNSMFTKTH